MDKKKMGLESTYSESKASHLDPDSAPMGSDRTKSATRMDGWIHPKKIARWQSPVGSRPHSTAGPFEEGLEIRAEGGLGLSLKGSQFGPLACGRLSGVEGCGTCVGHGADRPTVLSGLKGTNGATLLTGRGAFGARFKEGKGGVHGAGSNYPSTLGPLILMQVGHL